MRSCRECGQPEGVVKFYATRRTNVCAPCENKMRVARKNGVEYRDRFSLPERARYMRDSKLRSKYGITIADYEAMLDSQGGACAVCGSHPEHRGLCVDHDHDTGRVRGLLCDLCNRMLGQSGDNARLLRLGADYLDTHR